MDQFTQTIYLLHARILKALAHPKRLMIMDSLHSGEKSVGELVELLELPQATVSQHLAGLRDEQVVTTRREGNSIFYSLADPRIVQACDIFHQVLADRMKTSQAFADRFPTLRPFRGEAAPKGESAA